VWAGNRHMANTVCYGESVAVAFAFISTHQVFFDFLLEPWLSDGLESRWEDPNAHIRWQRETRCRLVCFVPVPPPPFLVPSPGSLL
jgi:hypothetical protein